MIKKRGCIKNRWWRWKSLQRLPVAIGYRNKKRLHHLIQPRRNKYYEKNKRILSGSPRRPAGSTGIATTIILISARRSGKSATTATTAAVKATWRRGVALWRPAWRFITPVTSEVSPVTTWRRFIGALLWRPAGLFITPVIPNASPIAIWRHFISTLLLWGPVFPTTTVGLLICSGGLPVLRLLYPVVLTIIIPIPVAIGRIGYSIPVLWLCISIWIAGISPVSVVSIIRV